MASTVLGLLEVAMLDCLVQSAAKTSDQPETLFLPAGHSHFASPSSIPPSAATAMHYLYTFQPAAVP